MIAIAMRQEHARISVDTRRAQIASFLVHCILLTWLALRPLVFPEAPTLTEIAWIDPESLAPASPPPGPASPPPGAASAPQVTSPTVQAGQPHAVHERQFERELTRSETAPALQTSRALQDVLNARATSMQQTAQTGPVRPIAAPMSVPMAGSQLAGMGTAPTGSPIGLRRGGGAGGGGTGSGGGSASGAGGGGNGSVPLVRAGVGLPGTSLQQLATVTAPKFDSERSRPQDVDRAKVRQLAGASLLGPIVDRDVVAHQTPAYPDWAEVQGIEATVSLYFVVRPDGRIKENILVEKTSGFEDFDANAVTALRGWRFEPLGPGATGEQWGRITFQYKLSAG